MSLLPKKMDAKGGESKKSIKDGTISTPSLPRKLSRKTRLTSMLPRKKLAESMIITKSGIKEPLRDKILSKTYNKVNKLQQCKISNERKLSKIDTKKN